MLSIPENLEGLEAAAEKILDPKNKDVVIAAIQNRQKWEKIKRDYILMRENGVKSFDAILDLSKKYNYSEKTIEAVIYERTQ